MGQVPSAQVGKLEDRFRLRLRPWYPESSVVMVSSRVQVNFITFKPLYGKVQDTGI
jgi:hypothetical protein